MKILMIESNLRVEKSGFHYIVNSSENDVFGQIATVCDSSKVKDWMNETSRRELLEDEELAGNDFCVKRIGQKYQGFKLDYQMNALKPSLVKFKDFITQYYKEAGNLSELISLFGKENTFINGRLSAETKVGIQFNTTFSSGQFRGLGVIDNFKRSTGSTLPASILSE
jgi:hypothetical protein